jgi:ABC-type uncharacterized transport system permease subunit
MIIPFYFFPEWAQKLLWWSPFPHYAYTPIGLLQDRVSIATALQGLVILTCWGVLFFLTSRFIWKKATHAYEGTGI